MRKVPLYVPVLATLIACTIAGCSGSANNNDADGPNGNTGSSYTAAPSAVTPVAATPAPATPAPTTPAAATPGVFAYVPSGLQSSCSDTGTSGHLPGWVSGYADSLTCNLGASTPAEVDYYFYNSKRAMRAAYNFASADDSFDAPQQPGGCTGGRNEFGTWSIGGTTIGDIACPINSNNGVDLIWDDPNTGIVAVANADYVLPADLYSWWQSNGASIDGSAQGATSS